MDQPKERGNSPWGTIQDVTELAEGLWSVSTASHGGIKCSKKRNAQIPDYMRRAGGWYEEDCEWSIPFVVFEGDILEFSNADATRAIIAQEHRATFRAWFPDHYERRYEVTLAPGQSYIKDARAWKANHIEDLQSVSAFGSGHNGVPPGYVGLIVYKGGRTANGHFPSSPERYFLVLQEEYHAESPAYASFLIDPSRHQEVEKFY